MNKLLHFMIMINFNLKLTNSENLMMNEINCF